MTPRILPIENQVFPWLIVTSFLAALGVFVSLFFVTAPYGRHIRRGWGATLPNRLGWFLMEAPSALVFVLLFFISPHPLTPVSVVFLFMWEAHYIHRGFIYPFTGASPNRRMPALVMSLAILFNIGNAYINARYMFGFSTPYPTAWLLDLRFLIGLALFICGFVMNRWADQILQSLRGGGRYQIPQGGIYRWISCPNYLGEIIEWTGWAIATWSIPGVAFAVWTFANLAPRASANHLWNRTHIPGYPKERKALIPGVW